MVDLVTWKPFNRVFRNLFNEVSPYFEDQALYRDNMDFLPNLDIKNGEKDFEVTVDLPGMDKKDVDISVEDGILTIKGERSGEKREEKDGYTYVERHMGKFERRIRLPENLDDSKLKADYKDGVLKLHAPKSVPVKPEPKRIEIK